MGVAAFRQGDRALTLDDVEVTSSAAELNLVDGFAGTAAHLNEYTLRLDIADGSAEATYYLLAPYAGNITKIQSVIDDVVSTADITVTGKIGSTAITNGALTIATAASAAGDIDSCTPSALNAITAGAAMNFVVTGGGAGGAPRIHLVVTITRT